VNERFLWELGRGGEHFDEAGEGGELELTSADKLDSAAVVDDLSAAVRWILEVQGSCVA
jgi:hypothetical protein